MGNTSSRASPLLRPKVTQMIFLTMSPITNHKSNINSEQGWLTLMLMRYLALTGHDWSYARNVLRGGDTNAISYQSYCQITNQISIQKTLPCHRLFRTLPLTFLLLSYHSYMLSQ